MGEIGMGDSAGVAYKEQGCTSRSHLKATEQSEVTLERTGLYLAFPSESEPEQSEVTLERTGLYLAFPSESNQAKRGYP